MNELEKLRKLTQTLTSNGYLTDQTNAWKYAFDSVNDAVCIVNPSLKIKFLNKIFCDKISTHSDQYVNEDLSFIFKDLDFLDEIKKDSIGKENTIHYAESFRTSLNGWYEGWRHSITTNTGKLIGYIYVFTNVTQRKLALEALKASESNYRLLFDKMQDGFALHEMLFDDKGVPYDYKFLKVNDAFEKLTGLKAEDLINRTRTEIFPELESSWLSIFIRVVMTGESIRFDNYSSELDKQLDVTAFSPMPGHFACIFSDITEKTLITRHLNETTELLEGVLNAIPDIIGVQDSNHNLIKYNKAGLDFFNVTSEDIKGKKCFEMMNRDENCDECQTRICKATKAPAKLERYIEELKGWYDCRSYPILNHAGEVTKVIEHLRDISDSKRDQAKQQMYYQKMNQAFRRLKFMITAVDGYLWEKEKGALEQDLVHTYVDPSMCREFFGIHGEDEAVCQQAYGRTTSELLCDLRDKGLKNTFGSVCSITDKHCEEQGVPCEYFEMGYVEHNKGRPNWFIVRVRKTPIYNDMGECTGMLGFANNCSEESNAIKELLELGLADGRIKQLATDTDEAKIYWLVKKKDEGKSLNHLDFP